VRRAAVLHCHRRLPWHGRGPNNRHAYAGTNHTGCRLATCRQPSVLQRKPAALQYVAHRHAYATCVRMMVSPYGCRVAKGSPAVAVAWHTGRQLPTKLTNEAAHRVCHGTVKRNYYIKCFVMGGWQ
jgi:hypothetical protein